MDNQHRKISGYRELSAAEIDLMNRIKEKGGELLELQKELVSKLKKHEHEFLHGSSIENAPQEAQRFYDAEPMRWAAIAKTDIQTGIMALVRAIAQPAGV